MYFEYTGAEVPPEGPLILLLSVILYAVVGEKQAATVHSYLSEALFGFRHRKVEDVGKSSGRDILARQGSELAVEILELENRTTFSLHHVKS